MVSDRRNHDFSSDYFSARTAFRELAEAAGGRLDVLPLDATGPTGQKLTIDVASFGSTTPQRVILHSSGLHGVEGFAGSAIQIRTLRELAAISDGTALILVHILNPFGMSWLRRTNPNNVDLNRNALGDENYSGAGKGYSQLNNFLNPASAPARDFFALKAALLILRHGMPALRQAVAEGQYEYPRGLFFGGKQLEEELRVYQKFLCERLRSAQEVIAIDVHTGLGKFGQDTLLAGPENMETLAKILGRRITSNRPEAGPAYRVRGGLETLISRAAPHAEVLYVMQEFGTYGPIRNLHALREENRWHHYGGGSVEHASKRAMKNAFCPDDDSWRESILRPGVELLRRAMKPRIAV
jgi:hypothetical protein